MTESRRRPAYRLDSLGAVLLVDADAAIIDATAACTGVLGYEPAALRDVQLPDLFGPDDREEVRQVIAAVLAGQPCAVVWPTRQPDGSLAPCEWRFDLWRDGTGRLAGVTAALTPQADQRLEWQRLRDADARFGDVVSGSAAMVWVGGIDGGLHDCNRAWREFVGPDAGTDAGLWRRRVHPADIARLEQRRARASASGRGYVASYRLQRRDGAWRWMEERCEVRGGLQERELVASCHDVTEQVESLNELQERESRLRLAMQSGGMGTGELDIATGRMQVTVEAAQLFGLSQPPQWALTDFLERIVPEDRARVAATIERIVRTSATLHEEFRIRREDGSLRWITGRGRLHYDEHGQPARVIGVLMDIHAHKVAEEELRRLSRRVIEVQEEERRHIARELHDQIGQSLTAALIQLQMVRESEGALAPVREALNEALRDVRSLSLNLRPSVLDSLGLVPALRWLIDRQAAAGKLQVILRAPGLDERLPAALETTVFRLVQESLTNVLRHARARHVRVDLSRTADTLRLTVADDGAGFDAAAAIERARASGSAGVLGMRERAELVGGTLELHSTPGRGTEVCATIPLPKVAVAA